MKLYEKIMLALFFLLFPLHWLYKDVFTINVIQIVGWSMVVLDFVIRKIIENDI